MKMFLFSLGLVLFLSSNAQTNSTGTTLDTTEIKLEHYKELFAKGLITAQEYEDLKDRVLGLQPKQPQTIIIEQPKKQLPKIDSNELEYMRVIANSNLGFGIAFLSVATVGWFTDAVLLPREGFNPLTVAVPILSAALGIAGIIMIANGAKKKRSYHRYTN